MAENLDSSISTHTESEAMNTLMEVDHPMPDLQNPKNPSDSDSGTDSDSDSDSDAEAQDSLQLQTLETELSTNPGNYDAHLQYIRALRKQGDIEKLRIARETMSELFPLTPEMWQEWIKDEISLSSGSDAFAAIEKLYERGVSDYLSVSLWCDYAKFVQDCDPLVHDGSPAGLLKVRNLFERALTAAGLHIAEGSKIWEAYRNFEQAILETIDKTDIKSREKQVQRIRNIFHRQLSVPHGDLGSTLLVYKAWEAEEGSTLDVNGSSLDGIPSHVSAAYQKALETLNARAHLEELISRKDTPDTERLQQYMTYLEYEKSFGDPARVQILFERAIAEFPISADLWLNYTQYLDKTLKAAGVVKDVYGRATRNCTWVGELWVGYLLSLERGHASEEEISVVFEKSLNCTFSSVDEYLNIFLTRVDGLRRRISLAGEGDNTISYSVIRDTFQRASDYLSPQLKNTDSLLQMHRYWARLESHLGKDLVAARGVWESLLKRSGSMLEAWLSYIAMEIEAGHINEARSIYKRCFSKRFSGTGSEDICHSWIRFEREFGTIEEFDHAVQKVTPRLAELQLFRLQQESKQIAVSVDKRDIPSKKKDKEKRKPVSDVTDEEPQSKRQKGEKLNLEQSYGVDKAEPKITVGANEKENAEVQVSKPQGDGVSKPNDSSLGKPRHYNDQCTAFISNLSLKATSDDLRKFFGDVGGVVDVRILKDKFTSKSRGLAYVDFSNDEHLAAALAKNKKYFLGKKISIARSDPKQGRKGGSTKNSSPMDYGKSEPGESIGTSKQNKGPDADQKREDGNVQIRGKNTFALPRAVRPLGFTSNSKPKSVGDQEGGDEQPKSNDEFRNLLLKK